MIAAERPPVAAVAPAETRKAADAAAAAKHAAAHSAAAAKTATGESASAAAAAGDTASSARTAADGSAAAAPLRHANANGQAATQSNPQHESHLECASIGELTSAAPRTQPGECALVEIAPSEREEKQMAADERRSTLMKTKCLSAFICVNRRPINDFFAASHGVPSGPGLRADVATMPTTAHGNIGTDDLYVLRNGARLPRPAA